MAEHSQKARTEDVRLIVTAWSDEHRFYTEAKCSVCGQLFPASKNGFKPADIERSIRAEFVDHVWSKHK